MGEERQMLHLLLKKTIQGPRGLASPPGAGFWRCDGEEGDWGDRLHLSDCSETVRLANPAENQRVSLPIRLMCPHGAARHGQREHS